MVRRGRLAYCRQAVPAAGTGRLLTVDKPSRLRGKAGRLTYRSGLLGKAGRLTKNLNFTRVRRLEMSKLQSPFGAKSPIILLIFAPFSPSLTTLL